jgi:hypothetical protein
MLSDEAGYLELHSETWNLDWYENGIQAGQARQKGQFPPRNHFILETPTFGVFL